MNAYQSKRHIDQVAVYLLGGIERWIEDYARSSQIPADVLTHRVAELLSLQAGGRVLGSNNHLPTLQRASTGESIAASALALARGSHRGAQVIPKHRLSAKGLRAMRRNAAAARAAKAAKAAKAKFPPSLKGFSYQGKHWTQQPENKARLKAQMKRIYAATHGKGK